MSEDQDTYPVPAGLLGRGYAIAPRPADLGGGWKLTLLEDGEEAGGGVFPIFDEAPQIGMNWWNALTEQERAHWLAEANSATPDAARYAYRLAETYTDAQNEGEDWTQNWRED